MTIISLFSYDLSRAETFIGNSRWATRGTGLQIRFLLLFISDGTSGGFGRGLGFGLSCYMVTPSSYVLVCLSLSTYAYNVDKGSNVQVDTTQSSWRLINSVVGVGVGTGAMTFGVKSCLYYSLNDIQ